MTLRQGWPPPGVRENRLAPGMGRPVSLVQEILSGPERTSVFGWKVAHANQKAT